LRGSIVFSLTSFASVKWLYPRCGQVKCIPLCTRHKVATLVFNGRILKWGLLHFKVIRARTAPRWNTGGNITTQLNTTLSKYSLFMHVGLVVKAPLIFIMSAYPCASLSVCQSALPHMSNVTSTARTDVKFYTGKFYVNPSRGDTN